MLNIILSGSNGAMGKVIDQIVETNDDIFVSARIDKNCTSRDIKPYDYLSALEAESAVTIDFSHPNNLKALLDFSVRTKTPLVLATTGLTEDDRNLVETASKEVAILMTSNTSVGVNLLIELVKKASAILSESFDIEIIEKHHNKKIDAPSGTAHMIANAINEELDNSMNFVYGREGTQPRASKKEIGIHTVRGGTIPGEHTVIFAGEDEILEIKHTAMSKKIFANGSLRAAKFLSTKGPGLYDMNDVI